MPSWPIRRALVTGPSMVPALRHGDQVLVRRTRRLAARDVGRVVVVHLPDGTLSVKRLVGLGDAGALWVEGDNPAASTDSRALGALPPDAAYGRVVLRIWPRPGYVRTSH